jgi:hypothetical protein
MKFKTTPEQVALLRRCASPNRAEALSAQYELVQAIQTPLREGILAGDILDNIFERMVLDGAAPEWPLDLLGPGDEDQHIAWTNPGHGRIPEAAVEGDYVTIPTYGLTNSIDTPLKYIRDARWDVVSRMTRIIENGFVKKMNDDGWHTILAAGVDRGILVYDGDAAPSQFTKRLISLMKTTMKRNAGGNSNSMGRGGLTDLYLSVEGLEDIRNWGVDQADEQTRREIYVSADDGVSITRIFGINLHALTELGAEQEYQNYYVNSLSGEFGPTSDVELCVGFDLAANDSFVMPIRQEVSLYEDEKMHRQQRFGMYGFAEVGFGILDSRRVMLGSF